MGVHFICLRLYMRKICPILKHFNTAFDSGNTYTSIICTIHL